MTHRLFFLAVLVGCLPTVVLAQATTPDTLGTHEAASGNHVLMKTVVKTDDGTAVHTRKTWNIDLLGISVTRDKYDTADGTSQSVTQYETCSTARDHYFDGHVMNVYFAFTGMATSGFDVGGGNSWEWGIYPLHTDHTLSANHHLGMTIAFGLSRSYYRLKGDGVLQANAAGRTLVAPIDPSVLEYTKPGINYWSWRLPICLEWQRPRGDRPFVSIGLEAELRHHVRSRVHHGNNHKHIIAGNSLDVQPWACNLLVQGGWGDFCLFARVGLTDFFGDAALFDATPFAIGIGF